MLLYYFQLHLMKTWGNNLTNMTAVGFVVADDVDETFVVVDEVDAAIVEHDVGAVVGGGLMMPQWTYHYLHYLLPWNVQLIRWLCQR